MEVVILSVQTKEANIRQIFGSTPYRIDFYQREYKWGRTHVKALLDDIFHRFEFDYKTSLDATEANIDNYYQWYFMSSFITNNYKGKTYIVDGQQRLTTLTLVLINLVHLVEKFNISELIGVLERNIYGPDLSGNIYWMGQDSRRNVLENLLNGTTPEQKTITEANMVNNFNEIKRYLEVKLDNSHKLHSFVIYLLTKVLFVNIHILEPTDVPMVFEVINDRGEKLKPYEVFKGVLLSPLDKDDIENTYLPTWIKSISSGNESFMHKLNTYNSADISNRWNRTLISSFYHTNKDFQDFKNRYSLDFKPYQAFDANAVEERQRLLFDMVKLIWG